MDAVRPPDADVVLVLLRARDYGLERALELVEEERARFAHLEREGGVDDIRGGQPVMEPPSRGAELGRDGVDEGGEIVLRLALELRHALRGWRLGAGADLGDGLGRDRAELAPGLEGGELDVEPAREPVLVRPDPSHHGSGVARNHRLQSRASAGRRPGRKIHNLGTVPSPTRALRSGTLEIPGWVGVRDGSGSGGAPATDRHRARGRGQLPRMRAASAAAFFALSTPTVATGTRRHLHDREQRIEPVEDAHPRAERHADHREVGVRRDHARERGGEAGAGDQHPDPALPARRARTRPPRPGRGGRSGPRARAGSRAPPARRALAASARSPTRSRPGSRPPAPQLRTCPSAAARPMSRRNRMPANAIRLTAS